MSDADGSEGRMRFTGGERMGCLGRFLLTVIILVLIMLGLGFLMVKTEGGRELVEDWLESELGMQMEIGRMKMGLPYALVIEQAVSKDFEKPGEPGFKAEELRIGLGLDPLLKVSASRCDLRLAQDDNGDWAPGYFDKLGRLSAKRIEDVSSITASFRRLTGLSVKDASICWSNSGGNIVAEAHGVSFSVSPVKLPGRKVHHHRLSAYNISWSDGSTLKNIDREWLSWPGRDYVEISREESGGTSPADAAEAGEPEQTPVEERIAVEPVKEAEAEQ